MLRKNKTRHGGGFLLLDCGLDCENSSPDFNYPNRKAPIYPIFKRNSRLRLPDRRGYPDQLRHKPGHIQDVVLQIIFFEQLLIRMVGEPRRQQVYIKRTAEHSADSARQ